MKKLASALFAVLALGSAPAFAVDTYAGGEICVPSTSAARNVISYPLGFGVQVDSQSPGPVGPPSVSCAIPHPFVGISEIRFAGRSRNPTFTLSCSARVTDQFGVTRASNSASIANNAAVGQRAMSMGGQFGLAHLSCSIPWANPAGGVTSQLVSVAAI